MTAKNFFLIILLYGVGYIFDFIYQSNYFPIHFVIITTALIFIFGEKYLNDMSKIIIGTTATILVVNMLFPIQTKKCSIVDDWVYPNYENATGAFKFNSDKSFSYSSTFFSITRYGTWKKLDDCTYLLTYQNGDTQTVSISNDTFDIGETVYIRY